MGTEVLCGSGNPDAGPKWHIEFMHGHGAVSERNYAQIMAECPDDVQRTGKGASVACTAALKQMNDNLGGMFDYSYYDDCIYDESFRRRRLEQDDAAPWRGGLNDYACPGDAMTVWLNRSDVRKALNIQPNNRFNSADNGVGMNYTLTEPNVLPIYEHARQDPKLRVLVYNGGSLRFVDQCLFALPHSQSDGCRTVYTGMCTADRHGPRHQLIRYTTQVRIVSIHLSGIAVLCFLHVLRPKPIIVVSFCTAFTRLSPDFMDAVAGTWITLIRSA